MIQRRLGKLEEQLQEQIGALMQREAEMQECVKQLNLFDKHMFEGVEAVIRNSAAHRAALVYKAARKLAVEMKVAGLAHGVERRLALHVTVLRACNLPKAKAAGTDAMCHLKLQACHEYTPVCRQSRNPEWQHELVMRVPQPCISSMAVEVLDHAAAGEHGFIGQAHVCAADIAALSDVPTQVELPLSHFGEALAHKAGMVKSTVVLCMCVVEEVQQVVDVAAVEELRVEHVEKREHAKSGSGPSMLHVTVVSGSHMPRMDGLLGTCDPYCVVRCGDKDMRTATRKGYDVRWDAAFDVDVRSAGHVDIEVWDHDAITTDDIIGKVWDCQHFVCACKSIS
jgi:Ca2+-dependent lipid-binding protein